MAVGRRITGEVPRLSGRSWNEVCSRLQDFLEGLKHSNDAGHPGPHASTHLQGGTDALDTPGTPANVGTTAAIGSGSTYSLEDHVHALTLATLRSILGTTTKGDLLADTGATLARVPVGANNTLLEAASGATPGVQWSTLETIAKRVMTANGDMWFRNGAAALARIPGHSVSPRRGQRLSGENEGSEQIGWLSEWDPYLYGPLADAVTTDVLHLSLPADAWTAITLQYAVMVKNGTDVQIETGKVQLRATRTPAGTITSAVEWVADPQVLSAGTLVVTWTRNDDAAGNRVTLRCNADTDRATLTALDLCFRFGDLAWQDGVTVEAAFLV